MQTFDPTDLLKSAVFQLGNVQVSVYAIGAALVAVSIAFAVVFTILSLVNLDMIAYHNEQHRLRMKNARKEERSKAYKAHMKRVRRYEAQLREERGY